MKVPPPSEPSPEPQALGTTAHPVAGPAHTGRMSRPEGSQQNGGFGGRERSGGQQRSRCYSLSLEFSLRLEVSVAVCCLAPRTVITLHPDGAGPHAPRCCVEEVLSHTGLASVHRQDSCCVFLLPSTPFHAHTPAHPSLCVTITSLDLAGHRTPEQEKTSVSWPLWDKQAEHVPLSRWH